MAYGTWPSPYSPDRMAGSLRLKEVGWAGSGLLWLEERSDRGVVCFQSDPREAARDMTPEHSVRARIGYGGGDFGTSADAVFYAAEQRIWRKGLEPGRMRAVTPQGGESASPTVSPDGQLLAYIHESDGRAAVALVDAAGGDLPRLIATGRDFYMQPAWHPAGERLAVVGWNHPNMPWTGTYLELLTLTPREAGTLPPAKRAVLAGGPGESVFQPTFSPDGSQIAFASDRSVWWNIDLIDLADGTRRTLVPEAAEQAVAAWSQGMRTFAFGADGRHLYYLRSCAGEVSLRVVELATGQSSQVTGELARYRELSQIALSAKQAAEGELIALLASAPHIPSRVIVVQVDPSSPASATVRIARRSEAEDIPEESLSSPRAVQWQAENGDAVHGIYYPPASAAARCDGAPPLIVLVHGGPTGQFRMAYSAQVQFFATRGYGVLHLNYRGSTGYGRAYRERLDGQWGILDLEDAIGGAQHLAKEGLADRDRMVLMGPSAGGYTVLRCLTARPGAFRAGISLFGISNLFTMAEDTHKFEAHYLDSMIGVLPEAAERYRSRSPIFSVDAIVDPVAVYQGETDPVVPRDQAESLVASLRQRSIPHVFELYPGEGHGWRKAETIAAFYSSLEGFLRQYVVYA